jgi:agmatinase
MTDLSKFDPNSVGNPDNNVFGLPFTEVVGRVVFFRIAWVVSVGFFGGAAGVWGE